MTAQPKISMNKLTFLTPALLLAAQFAFIGISHAAPVAAAPIVAPAPASIQLAWNEALALGDVEAARRLVAAPGFSPLMKIDGWQRSILFVALEQERGEIAALMIERAPAEFFVDGKAEIWNLAETENLPALRALLRRGGFDPNTRDKEHFQQTLLMQAANNANLEAMKLLLADTRTDINARDSDGDSVLTNVSSSAYIGGLSYAPVVALLLADKRMDVNAMDADGDTALHLAAGDNLSTDNLELLLLDPRVKTSLKNKAGQTPLALAIAGENLLAIEIMRALGVRASIPEMSQIAALRGKFNAPAPTLAPTIAQTAWLRIIVKSDEAEARQQIKAAGFDPMMKMPSFGGAPLIAAALNHDNPALALMLMDAARTDDYARDDTVLAGATHPANIAVLTRILNMPDFDSNRSRGGVSNQTLLGQCVAVGNVEGVRALLRHPKIDVNATAAMFGQSALHETKADNPNSATIAALLLADPRLVPDQLDTTGQTALYWVAFFGRPAVIKLIAADPRVDVNFASRVGAPLDMAASKNLDHVKALMDSGKVVVTPKQRVAIAKLKADWGLLGVDLFGEAK